MRAQVSEGRWASRAWGSKGAGTCGDGRRSRVVGASTARDHGREVGDELTSGVGGTEREMTARARGTTLTDLAHGERERERGHAGWRRQASRACLFSREFLIVFLFIFSRVFNSNSNQVSNSNQIKHVQQFKEYLGFNMMQHFMTHLLSKNKTNNPSLIKLTLTKREREREKLERDRN
jgi:hypothetical protein